MKRELNYTWVVRVSQGYGYVQIIILYTVNMCSFLHQLYLNKAVKKIKVNYR